MREFNVTGRCVPSKHYMVDISNKINQIAAMVERGDYFTINRARQYGKTTTLISFGFLKREGYLLTFDFRKHKAKKTSAKWVRKAKKKFLDCLAV